MQTTTMQTTNSSLRAIIHQQLTYPVKRKNAFSEQRLTGCTPLLTKKSTLDIATFTTNHLYVIFIWLNKHAFSALMCWLGSTKGIQPVKHWVVGCWHGYLSGARCRLAYGPADATASHCLLLKKKIQIGFTFLAPAVPGSLGQRAVKQVCVCVCLFVWQGCSPKKRSGGDAWNKT